MELTNAQRAYLPMSETSFYILLSLVEPRHGYGIMQHVESMTQQRLRLGAGTLYGSLTRMLRDRLIESVAEENRRKVYTITSVGKQLLRLELQRLHELVGNGSKCLEGLD